MRRDGPARPGLSGSSSDLTAGETAAPLRMEQSVTPAARCCSSSKSAIDVLPEPS
jgi:hypothetical protein